MSCLFCQEKRPRLQWLRELLQDETGGASTARCGLWLTVLVTLSLCVGDSLEGTPVNVPGAVYTLLTAMLTIFGAWAGGARFGQHLMSAAGSLADSVSRSRSGKSGVNDES